MPANAALVLGTAPSVHFTDHGTSLRCDVGWGGIGYCCVVRCGTMWYDVLQDAASASHPPPTQSPTQSFIHPTDPPTHPPSPGGA